MSLNNNILVKLENTGIMIDNKWLVKGVSLEIKKGKIVTLIGPNGSGKSTTAKIALGIYKKIEGKVEKFTEESIEHPDTSIIESAAITINLLYLI